MFRYYLPIPSPKNVDTRGCVRLLCYEWKQRAYQTHSNRKECWTIPFPRIIPSLSIPLRESTPNSTTHNIYYWSDKYVCSPERIFGGGTPSFWLTYITLENQITPRNSIDVYQAHTYSAMGLTSIFCPHSELILASALSRLPMLCPIYVLQLMKDGKLFRRRWMVVINLHWNFETLWVI